MKVFSIKVHVDDSLIIPYLIKMLFEELIDSVDALSVLANPKKNILCLSCMDKKAFDYLKQRVSDLELDYGTVHFISDNIYDL